MRRPARAVMGTKMNKAMISMKIATSTKQLQTNVIDGEKEDSAHSRLGGELAPCGAGTSELYSVENGRRPHISQYVERHVT